MPTKTCNTCNLTLDISKFYKNHAKCKKCYKTHRSCEHDILKWDCPECNPKLLCKHDTRKKHCLECNPKLLCKHGLRKQHCRKCNPKILCKHNTRKQHCPKCNPKILCEHGSRKQDCPKCNPKLFCEHGSRKSNCHICNPKLLCKHDKNKRYCHICNPKLLCEHNKYKRNCPECSPQNFCEHGSQKYSCPKCNPKILCKHDTRKQHCPKCNPKILCKHDKLKGYCHICSPQNFCIHCKHISGTLRYVESLDKKIKCCAGCFYYYYPNDKIPRRYKLKQHYFNEKLIEEFGVNFFQYDKKIKCGCSGRRPDWFIDCFKYSIIIELDEDQHKYESCDEKRMMELFTDLGSRPLVLIRINPDKYKGKTKKRKGCFDFDEKNTLICNEKKFNKRFNLLVKMIKYYIDNEPEKEITMEKLFFDRK